jgi:hypothetical protein
MILSRCRNLGVWMTVTAGVVAGTTAHAQKNSSAPSGPAPVLMTVRETVQPGAEATHAKLEADYAAALNAGKGNQYYLGMGAITGSPQTVFLSGYSSLQEIADVHDQDEGTMGEKLSTLDEEHSGTLDGVDTAIWRLRPSLSYPGTTNLAEKRFMELVHIHVKLGHGDEFAEVIKQMREAWIKADPAFNYSIYEQILGSSKDDSYLVVIAIRSLSDLDKHYARVAEYRKNLDENAERRIREFEGADYDSIESNLFAFTPSMSRLPASWTIDDKEFWNPKSISAAPLKKAEKGSK